MGQYKDDAPMTRKIICTSADCENPIVEEQYTYNASGKLVKTIYLSRGTDKMEQTSYSELAYNAAGQLISKIRYGKNSGNWVAYDEYAYEYVGENLMVERQYFNQRNPDQKVLTGMTEYNLENGKKVEMRVYDARKQMSYRVTYAYTNSVLTEESWFDATGKKMRYFSHAFAENRRQVSEYMPTKGDAISMVEKVYDKQGRLISEETKVINPLLCSMMPGITRYTY